MNSAEGERRGIDPTTPKTEGGLYQIGDRIGGKYEVLQVLGGPDARGGVHSGMGLVYVVYSDKDNVIVALKTFDDRFISNQAVRERFEHEARLWIELDRHPYIVRAHFVEKFMNRLFVVMEYIAPKDGRNQLTHYLMEDPPKLEQTMQWGIEFCVGMDHALAHRIACHGDIKPDNILIGSNGHVKITDFGLAAAIQSTAITDGEATPLVSSQRPRLSVIQAGRRLVCGTPGYMAPERWTGAEATIRSDVYAFGVVLYQMVAGTSLSPLFKTGKEQHRLQDVPPLKSCLWPVVERCLQERPEERYTDFGELRHDLEELRTSEGFGVVRLPQKGELQAWEWNNKGYALGVLGRLEDALTCFDRAIEFDSKDALAWCNKGHTLKDMRRFEEALASFERVVEIAPRDAKVWYQTGLGFSSVNLCRFDVALVSFERALEIDPRYAEAWTRKGLALDVLGRQEEALACYKRALDINPRDQMAKNFKQTLEQRDDLEATLANCERQLETDSQDFLVWYRRGAALEALSHHEEALASFARALEINPRYTQALNDKAYLLAYLGRAEEALSTYKQTLDIDSRNLQAWEGGGSELEVLGRHEEALSSFERLAELAPGSAHGWIGRGRVLAELSRHEEALVSYERAIQIDSDMDGAWYGKWIVLEVLGRREEAVGVYRHLIANTNFDADVLEREGRKKIAQFKSRKVMRSAQNRSWWKFWT